MDDRLWQAEPAEQGDCARPGENRPGVWRNRAGGPGLILDTNALSAFADGDARVGDVLRRQQRAAIPVIVLGEFRYGIADSRHRPDYEAWLDSQLSRFEVLDVTNETATAYAVLRVALKRSGRPIPANDAWIAALALQHRLPVLSRDVHFDAVPELERASW